MFKKILTDPKKHDSENFVYIAHGLMNNFSNYARCAKASIKQIQSPDHLYHASMIGKLSGETAKQEWGYCGGEISQLGTFGAIGLIVDLAKDNLVRISWNSDIGSPSEQEELKQFVRQYQGRMKTPFSLLTNTVGRDDIKYNELVIVGHKRTNITGIFHKYPVLEEEARLLGQEISELVQKDVPLIELPGLDNKIGISLLEEACVADEARSLAGDFQIMQAHLEFKNPSNDYFFN